MKICLFSPYFPEHFGGGEKYLLDVALAMAQDTQHQVQIALTPSPAGDKYSAPQLEKIKQQYAQFLGKNLEKLEFINSPLGVKGKIFKKMWFTQQYDVLFYLTDGSLFFSLAKKNILHIQVPLKLDKSSFKEQRKLQNWQLKTTNSHFTKKVVEPTWETKIDLVHQPMVDAKPIIAQTDFSNKQPIIINIGRFFPHLHSKRQDILVKIFTRLLEKYPRETKDWKLILIGSVEHQEYAQQVHQLAHGLPIEIFHEVSRAQLIEYLTRSSLYWHATGYRVNEFDHPEKLEHFGITTVEAMAAGNVPLVLAKGGQAEVIGQELKDWSWLTQRDCLKKTIHLIRHPELRYKLQQQAQQQALRFSPELFHRKVEQLLQ